MGLHRESGRQVMSAAASVKGRDGQDRRRGRVLVALVGMALWLGAGVVYAQTSCDPSTTPCQTCPPPPACTPSNTPCAVVGPSNTTFTFSLQTCAGSFDQQTTTIEEAIGPASICIGPDRSVGCVVPIGTSNINAHVDTILGSAVAIPTLSFWGLGALAVALGALALRRLASPSG